MKNHLKPLAQLSLALLFLATLPLWKRNETIVETQTAAKGTTHGTLPAGSGAGWISVLLYGLYAAVEVGAGLWANTLLIESRGVPAPTAGLYVACYFGAIMGGRMIMDFLVPVWGNRRSVTLGLSLALVGAIVFFVPAVPGVPAPALSWVGLVLMGLGFAPIYPCLMHETPRRFTEAAAPVVIGRQVGAAYVGGAIFPGLIGWTMAHTTLEVLGPILVGLIAVLWFFTGRLNHRTRDPKA